MTPGSAAGPLTRADVAHLKQKFPADIVDELLNKGELIVDEEKAMNYGKPDKN